MPQKNKLKEFIFNGLLLNDSLDRLEEKGISINEGHKLKIVSRIIETDFSPRIIYNSIKMSSVFSVFFCLENSVRDLIQERLAERHGPTWWNDKIPSKIKDNVIKLREKEKINRYLAQRSLNNIGYTFFGQLCQIIISNWEDFSDLFPDQHWINSRFNDLEMSRNIIMHTGMLPDIEIDRIESICRDWLKQVG
ncbi:MAG: hypothetical protein HZB41_05060 [Ignavibacteriae bacterium]|nr:hypothetical protein [Ignavibacteriota bacterium]